MGLTFKGGSASQLAALTTSALSRQQPASEAHRSKLTGLANPRRSHRPGAQRARGHRRRCHHNVGANSPLENRATRPILAASVWPTSVLSGHCKNSEVDFTDASYSRTQTAEVDATAFMKRAAELASVWITSVVLLSLLVTQVVRRVRTTGSRPLRPELMGNGPRLWLNPPNLGAVGWA